MAGHRVMRGAAALPWAVAALLLAEAGARGWPLWAGGMVPLAVALAAAAWMGGPRAPWGGGSLPVAAARVAMLPMMATLPAMGAWCSTSGWSSAAMVALHLAAMGAPALLLRAPSALACRVLLLAGGAALLLLPGLQGLALAATLHAAAAGVACAGHGRVDSQPVRLQPLPRSPHAVPSMSMPMLLLALAVVAIGCAIDLGGPAALVALHGALALVGLWPSLPALRRPLQAR